MDVLLAVVVLCVLLKIHCARICLCLSCASCRFVWLGNVPVLCSPHFSMGFLFLVLYPICPPPARRRLLRINHNPLTYNFVSHTIFHTQLFHIQHCHIQYNLVTKSFAHATLSYTQSFTHTVFQVSFCMVKKNLYKSLVLP